ncbi:unnamed protein product [Rotaria sp. Silwood1]|nr:unnamed protein product [Rotaria sp. Silwood1]
MHYRDRSKTLREKFNVERIPTLVTLFPTCEVIADDNIDADLVRGAYHRAVRYWCKGKLPYLLNSNSEEKFEIKTIWENDVKSIGFYFSADWCESCRAFTPKLVEVYKEAQAKSLPFRIVFVSSDFDKNIVQECLDIPRFFIVSSSGKVLSRRGTLELVPQPTEYEDD